MSRRDSGPFDSEKALDRLLAQARWPEPPMERIERLRASWRRLTGCRVTGGRPAWGLMLVAAGLLLAAGAACWRWVLPARDDHGADEPMIASVEPAASSGQPRSDRAPFAGGSASDQQAERANESIGTGSDASDDRAAGGPLLAETEAAWVRAPNRLEQTLMLSAGWPASGRRRASSFSANRRAAQAPALPTTIAAALTRWGLDRNTLTARAHVARERCEANLLFLLRNPAPTTDTKLAAIRLLALAGSPRSVPSLIDASRQPELHEPALIVLAMLAGQEAAAQLATLEPDATLRRRLWAEALRCAGPDTVGRYLRSVEHGDAAALAAAGDVRHPPLDALFFALESPRVHLRLAAARVLSRVDNTEVAQRLSRYVLENVSRQEALVALLARRDRYAALFIEQARDDLRLMALVDAAEGQLNSFTTETWR